MQYFAIVILCEGNRFANTKSGFMYCPKCGALNNDDSVNCVKCSYIMFAAQKNPSQHIDETPHNEWVSTIIPYKNVPALVGYYLGIFAILPLVGILLGIPAFFLGLRGLKQAKEHPESKGVVHAWIGIITGFIFGFGYLILFIYLLVNYMKQ